MKAVILCGGQGTRLRPFTYAIPKPLLPVGKKPILEVIIGQLRKHGFKSIYLAVDYQAELIKAYFQSGANFDVDITYLKDPEPLGTAGPLSALPKNIKKPFLVMNGDLLTKLDFGKFCSDHEKNKPAMTVGIRDYKIEVPFGILEVEKDRIVSLKEKPTMNYSISAGIYMLDPSVLSLIPDRKFYQITDLMEDLIKAGEKVMPYRITDYWLDIGQQEDFSQAIQDFNEMEF
jgi:NDP-sugar pyrophosphorylase family protein